MPKQLPRLVNLYFRESVSHEHALTILNRLELNLVDYNRTFNEYTVCVPRNEFKETMARVASEPKIYDKNIKC